MERTVDRLGQGETPEEDHPGIIIGDGFRIVGDGTSSLEMQIIMTMQDEPIFIQALNYPYPNKKHHAGETLGKHISNILDYIEEQQKYPNWRRQRENLRIIALGHDLAYPDVKIEAEIPSIDHGEVSEMMLAALTDIGDETILKIIHRHDEPIKLYRRYREDTKETRDMDKKQLDEIARMNACSTLNNVLGRKGHNFDLETMSLFIRFGYADRCSPQQKEYLYEMEFFTDICKRERFISNDFNPFS